MYAYYNANPSGKATQQMVQNMLQNGQMSQEQFNQLSNMANQIMPFMRK